MIYYIAFSDCSLTGPRNHSRLTVTRNGEACQRWDEQYPNEHPYHNSSLFPEATVSDAANYCRSPNVPGGRPWCYIDVGWIYYDFDKPYDNWDWCDVPDQCGKCTNILQ